MQRKEPKTMLDSGENYEFLQVFFLGHLKVMLIIPSCVK
jgi:hypothetical protein